MRSGSGPCHGALMMGTLAQVVVPTGHTATALLSLGGTGLGGFPKGGRTRRGWMFSHIEIGCQNIDLNGNVSV